MANRDTLFEADLGDNGGLVRLWNAAEVESFISAEEAFWKSVHQSDMSEPFNIVAGQINTLATSLREALRRGNRDAGSQALMSIYGDIATRIPLSSSNAGQSIADVRQKLGLEAAKGAVAITLPANLWYDGSYPSHRTGMRGMIEQVVRENGLTPRAVEAARRTLNGINARASQVLAGVEDRAIAQLALQDDAFSQALEKQAGRNGELERQRLAALTHFSAQASDVSARLEGTHNAYMEQMKLKAPVEYWRAKATEHRDSAKELRNWLAGFFVLIIGGYVIAFISLHQQLAGFLLQFQGSTGALLVISAAFALLASLPLWIGRLLVKFYLSEHHLATDAREREVMTQTYLALTAEGSVDKNDRSLILAALFRSTPDGVVKDNSQPDTSPAAMLSKLLDSR